MKNEIPMEFTFRGYEMDGEQAVGLIVDGGFVLKFQDENGNPIPLNKEAIDEFLKGSTHDKRKQIELDRSEIADIIAQSFEPCGNKYDASDFEWSAHCLLQAGYRKQSEVAREIFAEIGAMCIDLFGNFNHKGFTQLKKKYTEGT